jgi:tetratricopeptide (TPR) repeat protein
VAQTLNNIGSVYKGKGDYEKAVEHYNKCLEIETKIKGADSIDVAVTLNNIGGVYRKKREYQKALEYRTKSLDIFIKVNGGTCASSAVVSNNIKALKKLINGSWKSI